MGTAAGGALVMAAVTIPAKVKNAANPAMKQRAADRKNPVVRSGLSKKSFISLKTESLKIFQLKCISGRLGMEKTMNCMENSPKTTFWLEPRLFGVKSSSMAPAIS
jgi:hypothetical protein